MTTAVRASDDIEGELDVLILEDFQHGRDLLAYFLRADDGSVVELVFERPPPGRLRSGTRMRVSGQLRQSREGRGQQQRPALAVETFSEISPVTEPLAQTDEALDERRAVVLMVDLSNAKASSRYTLGQIAGHMFTNSRSVASLYREASLGQVTFPTDSDGNGAPDVFGPFAIAYDNSTCNYYDWAAAAEAAAEARGINLALYRHRVFVLPHYSNLPACSWAGVANVGCGTYCRAWIAEGESPMVYAHELGHNLNMAHAGTDPGNDGTLDNVYGDSSDPMGSSRAWHVFNAAHIDQMGWYAGTAGRVLTVTGSGTFDLAAVGLDPETSGAPVALKITKRDSGDFYYLSYRQPIGYDSSLSTTYTGGVNIHRYKGSGYGYTSHIRTLSDGASFTDTVNGITFTQVGRVGGYATVAISYGCALSMPQVALSPSMRMQAPGTSATFTVSLTNTDAACSATTFSLAATGTAPASLSPTTLTLAAGQSGQATLNTAAVLGEGNHVVQVTVTDADGKAPHHGTAATAQATLILDGTPPSVPTGVSASASKQGKVTVSWKAASDALSGVAAYQVYRNGAPLAQTSGTSYADSATAAGETYAYTVAARDGAGNLSAVSAQVSVIVPGNGKPGKTAALR